MCGILVSFHFDGTSASLQNTQHKWSVDSDDIVSLLAL